MKSARIFRLLILAAAVGFSFIWFKADAASAIETQYSATGPSSVSTVAIQDASGNDLYIIYYPSDLSANHPLITWGNGTDATADNYVGIMTHLASWGFVVIDGYCMDTGDGMEILDAALFMIEENSRPESIFYGKLDVNSVGAAGHSQGAGGAIRAYAHASGGASVVKTVVAVSVGNLELYDLLGHSDWKYDTSALQVPAFFTHGDGINEFFVSGIQTVKNAYNNMPPGIGASMGTCKNTDHNEIQNTNGGGKLRGYITAWLRWQLMGDTTARGAFAGSNPEFKTNTKWKDQATKDLN